MLKHPIGGLLGSLQISISTNNAGTRISAPFLCTSGKIDGDEIPITYCSFSLEHTHSCHFPHACCPSLFISPLRSTKVAPACATHLPSSGFHHPLFLLVLSPSVCLLVMTCLTHETAAALQGRDHVGSLLDPRAKHIILCPNTLWT